MTWRARLQLCYQRDAECTVAHDRHEGPLRVLRRLYPEGPGVCHHVLVHPPGGIVGGDVLEVDVRLDAGSHALITTPGASRFYRSAGAPARQQVHATLAADSRLEWLPLEAIAYPGCRAHSTLRFDLAPGAELIGCDLLALGLPTARQPFSQGYFVQELRIVGAWVERGRMDAADVRLLESPLGLDGRTVLALLWFVAGSAIPTARRDALLDAARQCIGTHDTLARHAGATAAHARVVVLRALAGRVEPAMQLLHDVWAAWRGIAWNLPAVRPRVWST